MKLFLLFQFVFTGAVSTQEFSKVIVTPSPATLPSVKVSPSSKPPSVLPSHEVDPTTSSHKAAPTTSSHKAAPTTSSHKAGPTTSSHKAGPTTSSHKAGPTTFSHKAGSTSSSVVSSTSHHKTPSISQHITPSSAIIHSKSVTPSNSTSSMHMTSTVVPTTPPKTTTPAKTTLSPDETFKLKVDNETCFQLKGDIKIMVTYSDVNNTIVKKTFHIGHNATATGHCSNLTEADNTSHINLVLAQVLTCTITFMGGNKWYMSGIAVDIHNKNKTNLDTDITELTASQTYDLKSNDGLYQAESNHSYNCATEKKLPLQNTNSTTVKFYNITVDFKDMIMQPFSSKEDSGSFINSVTCPATNGDDNGSSIVPIAVGCALAGLIVIVLIAYLIGRRKGNNRGYQQV